MQFSNGLARETGYSCVKLDYREMDSLLREREKVTTEEHSTDGHNREFTKRDWTAVILPAILWATLNSMTRFTFPNVIIFSLISGVPLLFLSASLAKRPFVLTLMGLASTILILTLRPDYKFFLGLSITSIICDIILAIVGYQTIIRNKNKSILIITISIIASSVTGFITGTFLDKLVYSFPHRVTTYIFIFLYGVGGFVGGILSIATVNIVEINLGEGRQ